MSARVVYFDCASGAAGDMLLGALVDLGLPFDALRQELGKLALGGYRLEAQRVSDRLKKEEQFDPWIIR